MAQSTPNLNSLPSELLLTILDHLTTPSTNNNLQPLSALSLTSSRLHRLTQPHLYHRFPGRNSELFLRTISQHPSLAQHVKAFAWHTERKSIPRIDMLEKQHIITRLNQLCVPHGTDLAAQFDKFGRSEEYWYAEVLMLFLPGLEVLEVRDSWLWDDHCYWFKSLSAFWNPLVGGGLRRVVVDGPLRVENVVPLLTVPTLRTLELAQVVVMRREGWRIFQWKVWEVERVLPPGTSNLETLALRESYVELESLLPVLHGIKTLKSFTYEHFPNDLSDDSVRADELDRMALSRCLETQRASLEHLRVRDTSPFNASSVASIFSACRFTLSRLHTLDIGPFNPTLYSSHGLDEAVGVLVSSFPLCLKSLRLKIASCPDDRIKLNEQKGLDAFLRALVGVVASTRPSMEEVQIVEWDPMRGWFPDDLPALQKAYADLSVRLGSSNGDVMDFYGAEPLLIDEVEEGWLLVTDLRLQSVA